jgi:hypothetical protein
MLYFKKNQSNNIVVTWTERAQSDAAAYYLLVLTNLTTLQDTLIVLPKVSNLSNFTERYDKFQVLTQFTQGGQYKYVAYESNTTALSGAIGVVETGLAQVETDQAAFASDSGVTRYVAFDTIEASVNPAPAPTIETAAGIYAGFANIVISSLVSGTIYYTTDGTTPSSQNGTLYTGAFDLTSTTLIQARQYVDGFTLGEVANAFYTINPITLTATPDTGTYLIGTLDPIVLETDSEGATIYYTTDGSTPTEASTEYTEAITPFDVITTLKARAFNSPASPSEVLTEVYSIQALAPTVSPASGTFINEQLACFSNPNPQGQVFVSLNGGAFQDITDECVILEEITTYVAEVRSEAYVTSAQVSGTISIQCSAPTISPAGQAFEDDIEVTITTTAPSGTTYYTLDGSEPTQSSLLYTAPFTLTASAQVRAKTFRSGTLASDVVGEDYIALVNIWVLPNNNGEIWLTTNRGISYSNIAPSALAWNGALANKLDNSIVAFSNTELRKSNNLGANWSTITPPSASNMINAHCDGNLGAMIVNTPSGQSLFVTQDGFETFTNVTSQFSGARNFQGVFVRGIRIFVTGNLQGSSNPFAALSTDNGVSFNQVFTQGGGSNTASPFVSEDGQYLSFVRLTLANAPDGIIQSFNGGGSFAVITTTNGGANTISANAISGAADGTPIFTAQLASPLAGRRSNDFFVTADIFTLSQGLQFLYSDNSGRTIGYNLNRIFRINPDQTAFTEIQPAGNINRSWRRGFIL